MTLRSVGSGSLYGNSGKNGPLEPAVSEVEVQLGASPSPWKEEVTLADEGGQHFVEVTLDVRDDSILLTNVQPATDDPECTMLVQEWERKSSLQGLIQTASNASDRMRNLSQEVSSSASAQMRQLSQDLKAELKRLSLSSSGAISAWGSRSDSARLAPDGSPLVSRASSSVSRNHESGLSRCRSGAEQALEGLRYISITSIEACENSSQWKAVQNRFFQLASPDGLLARSDFGLCIGMKDTTEFASELFDALARRRGLVKDVITMQQLKEFWSDISNQSFDSRVQIFFDMCDKNADGRISEDEVREVIELSASANKLSKLKEDAEEYAALIMEELDPDNLGYIELWQLEALLRGHFQGFACDEPRNFSQTLSQTLVPTRRSNAFHRFARSALRLLDENWQRYWVLSLWILAMVGLFIWKFLQYKWRSSFYVMGYCLCIAKGAAEVLKLNMALVLLPVCRITITWLRSTVLGSIVPFDDNINFHKTIAVGVAFSVILHAGSHLTCDFPLLTNSDELKFLEYVGSDFDYVKPTYRSLISGVEGSTGICMVILMTFAFVLASRWFRRNLVKLPWPFQRMAGFNAFWYSHHMFVAVYVLLVIHSQFLYLRHDWKQKTTWMYLAGPVLLYGGERTLRALRAGHYTVTIVKAAIYPGNVLALYMTKPPGFKYKSGMYTFLQCPDVSPFEWHPFSITSAPGDNFLSVHIRTVGDWTLEMKRLFSEIMEPPIGGKSGLLRADYKYGDNTRFPKLRIDGPYGAPAQDYRKYDVLVLVGLGIGATPFISILRDMLNLIKFSDQQLDGSTSSTSSTCSSVSSWSDSSSSSKSFESPNSKKKKKSRCPTNAYFYWVTREQGSFEWFKGVMNEVAEIDHKAVIEMHNYLSSVYEEGDARSALITMVQALHHARNGLDIVSGTRVRTHFAKPNWKKVFSRVASLHRESRIGVFYCGPLMLANELDALVREYNHSSSTKFEFHKENF